MDEEKFSRKAAQWDARAARWEARMERRAGRRSGPNGVVIGGIIVAVGLVLLLDNLGLVKSYDLWQYWPLVLVAVGISKVMGSHSPAAYIWGGIEIAVGTLLFLNHLGVVSLNFNMLWPLIIVAVGLNMFLRGLDRAQLVDGEQVNTEQTISLFTLFGGGKRHIRTADFRGGEVHAIFGGYQVDLRAAQMPSGRAIIDINAIFGGCELIVPDGWRVIVKAVGLFGGVEDKTVSPRPVEGVVIPELIITGAAVFGGLTIRN